MRRIKTVWLYVVFLFLALFLLSSSLAKRHSWNPVEQFVVEVTAPFQRTLVGTIRTVERVWVKYFDLVDLGNENLRLRREIDVLKAENDRNRERMASYERLRELLEFKNTLDWPSVAAQVIGRDPTGWFESVIIDKGRNSGLKMSMPVVNAAGVVGHLVSVSPNYSKVLLIVDQNSAVDCLVQRSREKGIVKGVSPGRCKMDYVLKTGDVAPGDRVVTSGLGGVYPKGLPVGEVVDVKDNPGEFFKEIRVKPMVNFAKLEELLVLMRESPLSNLQGGEDE
ncbi:MAG: rod shape-determining protein MreC [Thermodesulfobacteriota bacterium]